MLYVGHHRSGSNQARSKKRAEHKGKRKPSRSSVYRARKRAKHVAPDETGDDEDAVDEVNNGDADGEENGEVLDEDAALFDALNQQAHHSVPSAGSFVAGEYNDSNRLLIPWDTQSTYLLSRHVCGITSYLWQ